MHALWVTSPRHACLEQTDALLHVRHGLRQLALLEVPAEPFTQRQLALLLLSPAHHAHLAQHHAHGQTLGLHHVLGQRVVLRAVLGAVARDRRLQVCLDETAQLRLRNTIDEEFRFRVQRLFRGALGTERVGDAALQGDAVVVEQTHLVEPAAAGGAGDPLRLRLAGKEHLLERHFLVLAQEQRGLGERRRGVGKRRETHTADDGPERGVDEIVRVLGDHGAAERAVERGGVEGLVAAVAHAAHTPAATIEEALLQSRVLLLQQFVLLLELLLEGRSVGQHALQRLR